MQGGIVQELEWMYVLYGSVTRMSFKNLSALNTEGLKLKSSQFFFESLLAAGLEDI